MKTTHQLQDDVVEAARQVYGLAAVQRACRHLDEAANHTNGKWTEQLRYLKTRKTLSRSHQIAYRMFATLLLACEEQRKREGR